MDKKKLLLLVGALIIAIGTAFMARSVFTGAGAPQADAAGINPNGPKVLVAQRALPVGTIITADAMSFQAWPKEMVRDAYYISGEADLSKLLGTVVRFPITAGEPITQGTLVTPGDRGFLAAALGPGMRAVTVPVSAQAGVGGFVFPGDHIDLVLTQTVKGIEGQPLKASETFLRNLRVLATDQSAESVIVDGKTVVRKFKTVTIEVTPKMAEKIAVAQTIGTLTLSLRALGDNQAELERAIASGDVTIPVGATKEEEEKLLKAAMSRPQDSGTTFVTGGDVSRFQRRSMPTTTRQQSYAAPAARAPVAYAPARAIDQYVRPATPQVRVTRGKTTEAVDVGGN